MQPRTQFDIIVEICKFFSQELSNSSGNLSHCGRAPLCSDVEFIAISLFQDHCSIDSERRFFEDAGIELATPYRRNELVQYEMPEDYPARRKRVEVVFSQLVDQFSIRKSYAKSQKRLFAKVISKMTLYTLLQYINLQEGRSISHLRYTLAA